MLNNMKVLLGLLIVIAGLAFWVLQEEQDLDRSEPLIDSWQQEGNLMSQIDQVVLSQEGEEIVLKKAESNWTLNGGFYASIDPLFNLMQSFKNAQIVEAKTANKNNHAQIELADNDLKVAFFVNDQLTETIHVGKKTTSGLTFVRHADEDQTYTVKGLEAITFNLDSWQLKTVMDISGDQIQSIQIKPVTGDVIDVGRDSETGQFLIQNMPENHQQQVNASLDQLSNGLSRLMIDEALPLDTTNLNEQLTVTYGLINGQHISLKVYQQAEDYYMLIEADQYPDYAAWMMKIATYKFDALNRQLSDFIEPIGAQVDEHAEEAVLE